MVVRMQNPAKNSICRVFIFLDLPFPGKRVEQLLVFIMFNGQLIIENGQLAMDN
jgi:hypothetical protein